jgi:hypothetical protein
LKVGVGGPEPTSACAPEVAKAPSGTRNTTLNRAAYRLAQMVGGGLLDEAEVRARLRQAGLASGLSEREVR